MKQFYKSKSLLKLSFLFLLLLSIVSVANSCKDDDEDEFQDHLVQFEAKIVNGGPNPPPTTPVNSVFKTIFTQVGTQTDNIFNPAGFTWSSGEFFVNSSEAQLNFAANAELMHSDSKLIVNIWVDGEVAKTDTIVGNGPKSLSLSHSFLEL